MFPNQKNYWTICYFIISLTATNCVTISRRCSANKESHEYRNPGREVATKDLFIIDFICACEKYQFMYYMDHTMYTNTKTIIAVNTQCVGNYWWANYNAILSNQPNFSVKQTCQKTLTVMLRMLYSPKLKQGQATQSPVYRRSE